MNYTSISRATGISVSHVKKLVSLQLSVRTTTLGITWKPRSKLRPEHIGFLASEETLTRWAHLNLHQRAVLFHRRFPELKVSASLIQRFYKRMKIRFKLVRRVKREVDLSTGYYNHLFFEMAGKLEEARDRGLRLILLTSASTPWQAEPGLARIGTSVSQRSP